MVNMFKLFTVAMVILSLFSALDCRHHHHHHHHGGWFKKAIKKVGSGLVVPVVQHLLASRTLGDDPCADVIVFPDVIEGFTDPLAMQTGAPFVAFDRWGCLGPALAPRVPSPTFEHRGQNFTTFPSMTAEDEEAGDHPLGPILGHGSVQMIPYFRHGYARQLPRGFRPLEAQDCNPTDPFCRGSFPGK